MPQLSINQGPQDALLFDNTRSYFTNVGYVRTSNFQIEYRDVDPQNNATLGSTVQFVIPKAADLLGPVDLLVTLDTPNDLVSGSNDVSGISHETTKITVGNTAATQQTAAQNPKVTAESFAQWVDELGFAMIEKATFSVGSNDIETITGEQMQIRNELMASDEQRLGFDHVLKTGIGGLDGAAGDYDSVTRGAEELPGLESGLKVYDDYTRKIWYKRSGIRYMTQVEEVSSGGVVSTPFVQGGWRAQSSGGKTAKCGDRTLIIPLGLFFTRHVSQYFPLASIAGCNDIRISIKFRALADLVQLSTTMMPRESSAILPGPYSPLPALNKLYEGKQVIKAAECKLRCHYVHVTGPEAQALMSKEHVRLLKLYQHMPHTTRITSGTDVDIPLTFLHPVSTLIITIRKESELENVANNGGYFFYHGDGTNPNYDEIALHSAIDPEFFGVAGATPDSDAKKLGPQQVLGATDKAGNTGTVRLQNIQLTLNGQERHPGLPNGIDTKYLQSRLLPLLHSNSNRTERKMLALGNNNVHRRLEHSERGSKNIFVYPFALNPEGTNPSGSVNFSKVSHAKLRLKFADVAGPTAGDQYRIDVYALYYNWLQIKDGRALLSFA